MNVREQLAHYGLDPEQVMDMAGQLAAVQFKRIGSPAIESPETMGAIFKPFLAGRTEEAFAAAFLDSRHSLIKLEVLFRGTIDGATVYPRVVAERALRYGAAAVVFAHNHPSGVGEPSIADQAITRRLSDALGLLDIRVLDHFIVGDGVPVSMAARGLCGFHSSKDEEPARKAMRARQSEAMKKSWAKRRELAAGKAGAALVSATT